MDDALEELKILINAETQPLRDEMKRVQKEISSTSKVAVKEANKIGGAFSGLKGVIGKALVGLGLAKLGATAIELASNIEEVQNVVEVAFGSMTPLVEKFSKDAITQFGMSELTFKRTASTMMAMSNGMGFMGREAADMAIEVTKLTGDMSSFFNVSQDVAETALKGIWTGETEALKRFGVVMTQANLQQFAMRNGMNANIQKMSQQEQLMLRYNFVMDSLKLAQGDFARTQDSWANQTRILSEQFKVLLSIIGSGLIAALTPAIQLLNRLLSGIITVSKAIGSVFGKVFGLNKAVASTAPPIQNIGSVGSKGLNNLGNAAEKAGKKAKGALAPFDDLNVLMQDLGGSSGGAGDALGGVGGGMSVPNFDISDVITGEVEISPIEQAFYKLGDWISTHFGSIWASFSEQAQINLDNTKAIFGKIWNDILSLGSPLSEWFNGDFMALLQAQAEQSSVIFNGVWDSVNLVFGGMWDTLVFPFIQNLITIWLPLLTQFKTESINLFTAVFVEMKTIFDTLYTDALLPLFEFFTKMFTDFSLAVQDFWLIYGKPIFSELQILIQNLSATFMRLWTDYVKPVFDFIIDIAKQLWEGALKPIGLQLMALIGDVGIVLLDWLNNTVIPIVNYLLEVLKPAFDVVWSAVSNAVKIAVETISGWLRGIITILEGVVRFVTGVFTGNWSMAWDGVVSIFRGVWESIKSIIKGAWDFILGLFSAGGRIFDGVVGAIGNIFKSIVNAMISGINKVISIPFNAINGALGRIKHVNILGMKPFDWIPTIPAPQIPMLNVGTNYVARDGLAYIHEGEAVVPKKFNSKEFFGMSNQEQIELLREQNRLLLALLDKDTDVYLDGDKVSEKNETSRERLRSRLNYD